MTNETCLALRADLVAFLDEELPDERATAVRAHLEGCGECQAERDALAGSWKSLDLLPGLEPREGLFAEIEARVLASEQAASPAPAAELIRFPSERRAPSRLGWGVAAAALLMAGIGFGAAYLLTPNEIEGGGSQIAVQPAPSQGQQPDPIDMGQAPDAPRSPVQPDETQIPRVKIPRVKIPVEPEPRRGEPQPRDSEGHPGQKAPNSEQLPARPEVALAAAEWDALDPEEREIVENLDLLIELEDVDELEVIETLEVLDDLTDEELGEG